MPALRQPRQVKPASPVDGQVRFTESLTLAAVPSAAGAARRYVRSELTKAHLTALVDDAELVTSELATNAIVATGLMATAPKWPELEGLAAIRIRLGLSSSSVFIEVWDCKADVPAQKQVSEDEEGGRGLFIVDTLCTKWGARNVRSGGKVVWGELPLPVPTELPRRLPNRRYGSTGPRGTESPSTRAVDRSGEEVVAMRKNGSGGG